MNIGDRIEIEEPHERKLLKSKTGTVTKIENGEIVIEMDSGEIVKLPEESFR